MRDLSHQIDRLTGELRSLRLQLEWSSFRHSSHKEQERILHTLLNAGLVEHLRTVIDQFSHFLWCYVESAAANSGPDVDLALQSKRLEKVTDMLRLLRHSSARTPDQLEFFARVTGTVDRHLEQREKPRALGRSA
jgi:3-methyladenine DNA glycosylase Tag